MHAHESCNALRREIGRCNDCVRCLWAITDLKVRTSKASNTGVNIPYTCWCSGRGSKIVFNEDGTCLCSLRADNHIGPFNAASVSPEANLDHRPGIAHVGEE